MVETRLPLLCGCAIAPALDEDAGCVPMLAHRAPEILHPAADTEEYLIQVSLVARLWSPTLQHLGEQPAEAQPHSRMLSSDTATPRAARMVA
jgi:hypothetical protein